MSFSIRTPSPNKAYPVNIPIAPLTSSRNDRALTVATFSLPHSKNIENVIIKQGYLTKQGGARGGLKNWKKRWVVLKQDCLYYYKTKPERAVSASWTDIKLNSSYNSLYLPTSTSAPGMGDQGQLENYLSSPTSGDPNHVQSLPDISSTLEENDAHSSNVPGMLLGVTLLRGAKVLDLLESNSATISSFKAPEFDSVSQVCSECKKYFGVMLRRHHCRNCGRSFCKQHLLVQLEIPKFGYLKPVPVCTQCSLIVKSELESSPIQWATTSGLDDRDSFSDEDEPVVEILTRRSSAARKSLFGTRKYMFAIKSPERELWLSADDEQEKKDWINAIRKEISNTRRNLKIRNMLNQHEEWELDFSNIKIIRKLGQGAFGEVFLGRLWGTDVAVKMFKPEQITENTIGVLKKEISILSRLRHPNVVLYMGACTRPPNVCIVTESCDQGNLYDVLHDYSIHIDAQRVVDIAVGIAQGMNYLHSLDKLIIHRDLKSHNILVDKNFGVKVADFGLSHMRMSRRRKGSRLRTRSTGISITSLTDLKSPDEHEEDDHLIDANDEIGRHYGILGTPEWMAPEVLEGIAYNQKVDVYSYGIILCELVSREAPYRERRLKGHMDVVEAILEEGAKPSVPEWCGIVMKKLIDDCLDRDPSRRPSFFNIILRLRQSFSLDEGQFFRSYDVPRLKELLQTENPKHQKRAAHEIADMRHQQISFCPKCGPTQGRFHTVDEPTMSTFVSRLTSLISSKDTGVASQSCRALHAILLFADSERAPRLRKKIRDSNGFPFLLQSISSGNEFLKHEASNLLSELTPDLLHRHSLVRSLDENCNRVIENLVTQEIRALSAKLASDLEVLRRKLKFKGMLKESLSSTSHTDIEVGNFRHLNVTSTGKLDFLSYLEEHEDKKDSERSFRTCLENGLEGLHPRSSSQFSSIALNPSFPAPSIITIPDDFLDGNAPSLFVRFLQSKDGIPNGNTLASDYAFLVDASGKALLFDSEDSSWKCVFLVLSSHELRVYSTDSDDPSKPLIILSLFPETFGSSSFSSGRKHCKPHCLQITDGISQGIFCFRSQSTASLWRQKLSQKPKSIVSFADSTFSDNYMTMLLESTGDLVLPESFLKFFGENSIWRYANMLFRDRDTKIWAPVFVLFLNGKELKVYETSADRPENAFICLDVEYGQIEIQQWEEADRSRFCFSLLIRMPASGTIEAFEFCVGSIVNRDPWVRHFRHSPSLSAKDSQSQLLRILFQDSDAFANNNDIKSIQIDGSDTKQLSVPSEEEEEFDEHARIAVSTKEVLGFNENEISPKFIARYGRCARHGYLNKRGRVRKNWKRRYFYLVGTELHYFVSHLSRPQEFLGTIHLGTASGQQFKVEACPKTFRSRPFCFAIESPGRRWYLEASSQEELEEWIESIQTPKLAKGK